MAVRNLEADPTAADSGWAARPAGLWRRFWRLAVAYYTSGERWSAWGLTAGVLALTLLQIGVQLRLNLWSRDFFNALEHHDRAAFLGQMRLFLLLAAVGIGVAVLQYQSRQILALRWREWLVRRLQARLLEGSCHYRLQFLSDAPDNPDQRISENTRWATATAVELAVGLIHSVLLLASFAGILWNLSGPLSLAWGPLGFEIPGYMVFASVLYAGIGAGLTWMLGRAMIGINARRNQAESDHRFSLVRLRENSEGVALIRGERDEERGLAHAFACVVGVMEDLFRRERFLVGLSCAYGMVTMAFPILVASPRYFAGAITLGTLMQVSQAFCEVTKALNWFMDNYSRLADWTSHVERVVALEEGLASTGRAARGGTIRIEEGPLPDGREVLSLRGLDIATPEGHLVLAGAEAEILPGERVLIVGESGSGKSTLFRAIAGLWPWGSGSIRIPPRAHMMFMPQRSYLPLGSLHAAVAYPAPARHFPEAAVAAALTRCGLGHLVPRLREEERWDRILSLGEQQRLAFARLLLHRPRWVFMDEATAALDEANQDAMMRLFHEELAETALVSIGHRPGLDAYHDRTLTLLRSEGGARLQAPALSAPRRAGSFGRMAASLPAPAAAHRRETVARRRRPARPRRLRMRGGS